MDYAMPRADDLPSLDLGFIGTRCTTNPLGVKGCGEAGASPTPLQTRSRLSVSQI
jgi:carbon-monoxide dehydrogenase large subunit